MASGGASKHVCHLLPEHNNNMPVEGFPANMSPEIMGPKVAEARAMANRNLRAQRLLKPTPPGSNTTSKK